MKEALIVLNELVAEGMIEDYAIGGAMGATFYLEPVLTMDLDVFVIFPDDTSLLPLQPIYDNLRDKGYLPDDRMPECINIGGTPVQFLPAYNDLLVEALAHAKSFDYDGVPAKVLPAEYLAAISQQTARPKDKLRVRSFLDSGKCNLAEMRVIFSRFNLKWPQEDND